MFKTLRQHVPLQITWISYDTHTRRSYEFAQCPVVDMFYTCSAKYVKGAQRTHTHRASCMLTSQQINWTQHHILHFIPATLTQFVFISKFSPSIINQTNRMITSKHDGISSKYFERDEYTALELWGKYVGTKYHFSRKRFAISTKQKSWRPLLWCTNIQGEIQHLVVFVWIATLEITVV